MLLFSLQVKRQLLDKIKAGFMTQLYREVSAELKLPINNSVLEEMEAKNKEEIEKLTGRFRTALLNKHYSILLYNTC